MKKTFFLLFTLMFAQLSHGLTPMKDFTQGSMELGASFEYFRSEENYKSGGSKESLPSGFHYQLMDFNIQTRFVLAPSLGLYASANIGTSESKSSTEIYTNSTLNWVEIGGDYLIIDNDLRLVADVSAIVPLEKVSDNMETSLNWDGAMHFRPRAIVSYETNGFVPYASLGVDYRDKGLSTLATFSAGLSSSLKSDLIFGGEINGYSTIIKDNLPTERESERLNIIGRYNASSKKFYSINPSLFDSELYLKYRVSEWQLGASAGMTLAGSDSASGYHGKIFLTWNMDKISSSSHNARPTSHHYNSSSDIDESLEESSFNSSPYTSSPAYVNPAVEKEVQASEMHVTTKKASNPDYKLKLKKVPTNKKKR